LAVLAAPGLFRVYRLQRPVPELVVVADSFHTKPLMRILQSADRYQVLGLNRQEIKLFEGNRDALDEIELAQGVAAPYCARLFADYGADVIKVEPPGLGDAARSYAVTLALREMGFNSELMI